MLGLKEHTSFILHTRLYVTALDLTTIVLILHLHRRESTIVSRKELHTVRLPSPVTVRQINGLSLTVALKAFGLLPNLESRR